MPSLRVAQAFKQSGDRLWTNSTGGHVYIETEVMNILDQSRQRNLNDTEAGGFLAGYFKGSDIHIIRITEPFDRDARSRTRFERRDIRHVRLMEDWYRSSGRKINCLGEWHTHPEKHPSPSVIDRSGWADLTAYRQGIPTIFFIAGIAGNWCGNLDSMK